MPFSRASSTKLPAEVRVTSGERCLDVLRDRRMIIPQGRIELDISEFRRIVLRRRMAPASRACGHSSAHTTAHAAVAANARTIRHRSFRKS